MGHSGLGRHEVPFRVGRCFNKRVSVLCRVAVSFCLPFITAFDSVNRIVDSADFGGVRLREASTLRFEGRIPTFLKRCGGNYAGEGNVPQSVVLCDATIVSADYLAVV